MNKERESLLKRLGTLNDQEDTFDLGDVPSGSFALNHIITGDFKRGYPIGRLIEIFGESSTGKTVWATHAIREAQKKGYYTGFLDNEFSYDPKFAKSLGVDNSKLIYAAPDTVIKCFAQAEEWWKEIRKEDADTPIVIVLDSLAGQSTLEEEKAIGEFSNTDGARRAVEIGQTLRQLKPELKKNKVCFIVINQVRVNIADMYGNKIAKSGGGKALDFWSDISLQVVSNKTSDVLKDDTTNETIGIQGKIRTKKNKVAIPFREVEFRLIFNKGIDPYYGLLPVLINEKVLTKKGGWYEIVATGAKFQEGEFLAGKVSIPGLDLSLS
jgi:recombination protein RecA